MISQRQRVNGIINEIWDNSIRIYIYEKRAAFLSKNKHIRDMEECDEKQAAMSKFYTDLYESKPEEW